MECWVWYDVWRRGEIIVPYKFKTEEEKRAYYREAQRKWRAKNRERSKATNRRTAEKRMERLRTDEEYRKRSREIDSRYQKKKREKYHAERRAKGIEKYRKKHKTVWDALEARDKQTSEYQKRNRERLSAYRKEWAKKNPEKVKAYKKRAELKRSGSKLGKKVGNLGKLAGKLGIVGFGLGLFREGMSEKKKLKIERQAERIRAKKTPKKKGWRGKLKRGLDRVNEVLEKEAGVERRKMPRDWT